MKSSRLFVFFLILLCALAPFAPAARFAFLSNLWPSRVSAQDVPGTRDPALSGFAPSGIVPSGNLDFQSPLPPAELAQALSGMMSDEELLAQTLMFGWVGASPSPLIVDWIRDRNIGGVKIFGWNTDDTTRLAETVGELQRLALGSRYGIPLLVATDQEGGWIRHVKGATSETPGNMAIGASGYPQDAYYSGYYIGKELSALGINMNFAPTVDLYTNRASYLIGPRAFGDDPVRAGLLGAAFVRGQKDSGIIATAKHYPGHGDTDLDSHGVLPRINADFETLWNRELLPYRILAKEKIPAVMSGHLAFPNTRAEEAPASLSPWFLKDVLRDTIGFEGLIITDDLMMNGAAVYAGSLSGAARAALMAGNDIIMLSKTPSLYDPIWTSLVAAMKNDGEFRERVRDAARRALAVKLEYLRSPGAVPPIPDLERLAEELPNPEGTRFFLNLAARSVTVVKGEGGKNPFPLEAEEAGQVLLAGQYGDFLSCGVLAFPGAERFRFQGAADRWELARRARNADTVIFCLAGPDDLALLNILRDSGRRVIVFSILSPVYLEQVPWIDGAVAVYSYARESFIAGFSAMVGRIPAEGVLPFNIEAARQP